jgi:hypothetical protein
MFPTHEQVAAEHMKRLMQFPPDLMLWNGFLGASWSAWLSIWGFDPQVWARMFEGGFAAAPVAKLSQPVAQSAASDSAEPADSVKPMPDNEPVQPSFA